MALNIYNLFSRYGLRPDLTHPTFAGSYLDRDTAMAKVTEGERHGSWISEMNVRSWTGDYFSGRYYVSEWFYFDRNGNIISHKVFNSEKEGCDLVNSPEYREWLQERNNEALAHMEEDFAEIDEGEEFDFEEYADYMGELIAMATARDCDEGMF